MPLLRINAAVQGLCLHGSAQPVASALSQRLAGRDPVVVMVHGYKYSPFVADHCPHARLFHAQGWPAGLGVFDGSQSAIAFGWHARGGLRTAHSHALERAVRLAELVRALRGRGPVHLITHSLGATLVLAALPYLNEGDVARIVVLNGAAHLGLARHALATPCGQAATLFHVTSRENRFYDLGFEAIVAGSGTMGRGLQARNTVEIQISCAQTLAGLRGLGYDIAPPQHRVCHWSSYKRPGVMALNAALLNGALDLPQLRAIKPQVAPRWTAVLRRKSQVIRGLQSPKGPLNGRAS
ncbi:hypothetical protein ABMC88_06250 [Sulfitobacter sp. HNIBRBA2951]|uniref:hypothetical protein n=1 Tax=Sulfitobacter aquimarinus TaxID=3158557 RepID=UPI0032DF1FA9